MSYMKKFFTIISLNVNNYHNPVNIRIIQKSARKQCGRTKKLRSIILLVEEVRQAVCGSITAKKWGTDKGGAPKSWRAAFRKLSKRN